VGKGLFLKCEGVNFAGSAEPRQVTAMVEAAERDGVLRPGSILIESSSGDLGVALSMIAASRGYRFLWVTDPRCDLATRLLLESSGAQVHVVTEPAEAGGFLGARLAFVRRMCAADERYVWLDRYRNANAWKAHYRSTGPAIARAFPELDVVFVGTGTTATSAGCARYFRDNHPGVRIVAVDPVGPAGSGTPQARRTIPGPRMHVVPPLLDPSPVDEVVHVEEADGIRACHRLARRGFLFGGSTGAVVSGAVGWLERHDPAGELTAVAPAPDMGERYLGTIYRPDWVRARYGTDVLVDGRPVAHRAT
jgi:cysteine synthase A